jgi:hypothetical protein
MRFDYEDFNFQTSRIFTGNDYYFFSISGTDGNDNFINEHDIKYFGKIIKARIVDDGFGNFTISDITTINNPTLSIETNDFLAPLNKTEFIELIS